jgi:DNA invertase Pin-like site-specific DNA recombinase
MKRAISYIRVSTDDQAQNGNGLDKQLEEIRAYAERNSYSIETYFEDVGSARGGKSLQDLADALRYAKQNDVVLIVANVSRLSRDAPQAAEILRKLSGRIISCHPDQRSAAARSHAAQAADQGGKNIASGTKVALAEKKRGGMRLGNPESLPRARSNSARIRRDKAAQHLLDLIRVLKDHPDLQILSAARLASELNTRGMKASRGGSWTRDSLKRPLKEALRWIRDEVGFDRHLDETPLSVASRPAPAVDAEEGLDPIYLNNTKIGMF